MEGRSNSRLRALRARFLRSGRATAEALVQVLPERPRNAFLAQVARLLPSPYHAGELEVQRRAGLRAQAARSGLGVGAELPRGAEALLGRLPFIVAATCDEAGALWVTTIDGSPGFLRAEDPFTVLIDSAPRGGDPLASALTRRAEIGLLAIDLGTRERLRVNGLAQPVPGGGLRVSVRSALINCPKYIKIRELRAAHTSPAEEQRTRLLTEFDDECVSRVRRTDTLFIGTRHPEGGSDVSHRGGPPGFLRIDGPRRVVLPDYVGNAMFQTLGNLTVDGRVGLLLPDFEDGTLLRLSGRASIDWDAAARRKIPAAQRLVRIDLEAVCIQPNGLALRT